MPLNPSTQFVAKNDLFYKTPIYLAEFQTQVGQDTYTITDVNPSFPIFVECSSATWTLNQWVGYTAFVRTAAGYAEYRTIASNDNNTLTFYESLTNDSVAIGDSVRIDLYEKFCTYLPKYTIPSGNAPKPYISYISGGGYSISPDEGSTSSSTLSIELQDVDGYVTSMIAGATGKLQKKRCIIKAGYLGLTEAEMLTVYTGEITDYDYQKDGSWSIGVSDSIRALNKNVFRGASDTNPNILTGNPITLTLGLLISDRGDGAKGPYDFLPGGYGLDLPVSQIDVETFEQIRDTYYPTTAATFHFEITERSSANDFLQNEIYKPLNMYPIVKGNGQYSARIYRPILPPLSTIALNENDMIDIPDYSGNLPDLINEVQFSYNYDGNDFVSIDVYADAESINSRGVGDRTLEVESHGINSSYMDTDDFLSRSALRIFLRYATPPIKLNVKTFFKELLIESGDIISVSNKFLPNLATGNFDFEYIQMEVLKRTVDWKRGSVNLELLQTGFAQNKYAAISPKMFVNDAINSTEFETNDINFYQTGFVCTVYRKVFEFTNNINYYHLELIANDITINSITTGVSLPYLVTTENIGTPYTNDMILVFNDTPTSIPLTLAQEEWGRIGAGYLITP